MKSLIPFVIILFLLSGCGKVPLYEPGLKVPLFQDGFETGSFGLWHDETARVGAISIVSNPVATGTFAAKFELRPQDYINRGVRAELALYGCAPYGSEVWYTWRFMIPADYQESSEWQVIGQWHDMPDFLKGEDWNNINTIHSPPVQLSYKNGTAIVLVATPDNIARKIGETAITKGSWNHVMYRIFWHRNRGYVETWINGIPITAYNGKDHAYSCSTAYNEAGCYFKIGLYRSKEITSTNTIYYDDIRIGNAKEEVFP